MVNELRKGDDGRWYKSCPSCGSERSYLRKNYALNSLNSNKDCKSCSNKKPKNNYHKGWVNGVLRKSFINKYKMSASSRGIEFNVDDVYLANLLIDQKFKCSLSGLDICAMDVSKNTASLDRIDSSKGYVKGNLHWVHKMVNMCKQSYSLEEFINMCNLVSKK